MAYLLSLMVLALIGATPTPGPTPLPTVPIAQQIDRAQLEFPLAVGGTQVPDTTARGIDFRTGFTCTSVPRTIQGRTLTVLHCDLAP